MSETFLQVTSSSMPSSSGIHSVFLEAMLCLSLDARPPSSMSMNSSVWRPSSLLAFCAQFLQEIYRGLEVFPSVSLRDMR